MSEATPEAVLDHRARIERCEPRLVLSGDALWSPGMLESPPSPWLPAAEIALEVAETPVTRHGVLSGAVELVPVGDALESHLNAAHQQSGVDYVHQEFAFDGAGQTVVVIDTGIAYDHVALGGGFGANHRVVGGWDFSENDADPYDDGPAGFHGTHVAGIIGSDDAQRPGVAPGVDFIGLRVFNDQGSGTLSGIENALQWVHANRNSFANPITTVNMSLGMAWNSDSVPYAAALEDELAQLEADGIFIAVSAGNSFQEYGEAGLSYPAASPYVVPVASVGEYGQISDFSQRNDRVLAAPGERIASTVPDYLYGHDGVADDWAYASGTSMAAPYVAGSSVLVREAMDFVGYQTITQDVIYDHLRQTADLVYDAATDATYHRINMRTALDALMPTDDYGDVSGHAHQLGAVQSTLSFSGTIGRVSDVDVFRFTAGASGRLDLTSNATHALTSVWTVSGASGSWDGNVFSFDVEQGQTYELSVRTTAGVGHYTADATLTSNFDPPGLGVVDWLRLEDQTVAGASWHQVTAARDGWFTVTDGGNAAATLELTRDPQAAGVAGADRVDLQVQAGETLYLKSTGATQDLDLTFVNLVRETGSQVHVFGTEGDDAVSVRLGATSTVDVGGVEYETAASWIGVDLGDGDDAFSATGSATRENFYVAVGAVDVAGGGRALIARSAEDISVVGGVEDYARFYGSAADESFTTEMDRVELASTEGRSDASGMTYFHIDGGGGQDDVAIADTAGDDYFARSDSYSLFKGSGFRQQFVNVEAFAVASTAGGYDRAAINGSAGDDTFTAHADWSEFVADGFSVQVRGFDRVDATAGPSGNDRATFHDSGGDDYLLAKIDYTFRASATQHVQVHGFDSTQSFSTVGNDTVAFYDSVGDDLFISNGDISTLYASTIQEATGFATVKAYATAGGNDRALLYDTPSNDAFSFDRDVARIVNAGSYRAVQSFETVDAYSIFGGHDTAQFADTAYDDTFTSNGSVASLSNAQRTIRAYAFDQIEAASIFGGTDRASLTGSSGADVFVSTDRYAWMTTPTQTFFTRGFDRVEANGGSGADTAYAYGSHGVDRFFSDGDLFSVANDHGGEQSMRGFQYVRAFGRGGEDVAILESSAGGALRAQGEAVEMVFEAGRRLRISGLAELVALSDEGVSTKEIGAVDYLMRLQGDWE